MRTSDRKTLKGYFQTDSVPTSAQFEELIDSVYNLVEDGDLKNNGNGLVLRPSGENKTLLEIYPEDIDGNTSDIPSAPCWSLVMNNEKNIELVNADGVIVFSTGVKNNLVSGDKYMKVKADGNWHTLLFERSDTTLKFNCEAYRILAYYKCPHSINYKFTEVAVSHCDKRKLKLSSSSKHYGMWFSKIKFRWKTNGGDICLQVKSKRRMPANTDIQCNITKLWDCTYGE